MSACKEADIEGLVFGALTSSEAIRAEEHLASCPRCRDEHTLLMRERRLFLERGHLRSSRPLARERLPEFETIFAQVTPASPSLFRRALAVALGDAGWRSWAMNRVVPAVALALVLISVGRKHHTVASNDEAIQIRQKTAKVQAPVTGTEKAAPEDCSYSEAVCRESQGVALGIDRAMSYAITTDQAPDCTVEQVSTASPHVLDRPRSDNDAMCISGAI